MEKIEVKWLKAQGGSIAQIYSSGLEFCFISDDMKQCHKFVFCKDFLQDAIHGHLHSKPASIYGFSYDPTTRPGLCTKRTRIALTNRNDKDFREKIPHMIDFVNQVARKLKLKQTKVFESLEVPPRYEKCGVFITDGSPMWMNSPPLVSMYTLMMRCGFAHTSGNNFMDTIEGIIKGKIKPYQSNDRTQLSGSINGIKNILKIGYRKFFFIDSAKNYPKDADIDTMHNSCGIVGFSNGYSRSVVRYWHRKSLKDVLEGKVVKKEETPASPKEEKSNVQ
jgi:hypothetical protein